METPECGSHDAIAVSKEHVHLLSQRIQTPILALLLATVESLNVACGKSLKFSQAES